MDDDFHTLFTTTVDQAIRDLHGRIGRISRNLAALKNQDSDYAEAHRRLIAAHTEAAAVYQKHLGNSPT